MDVAVEHLMTPYPVVVDAATPVAQCARLMDDRDIGALGVMDEGRLVGVLTDRDIVVRAVARDRDAAELGAGEIASQGSRSGPAHRSRRPSRACAARRSGASSWSPRTAGRWGS